MAGEQYIVSCSGIFILFHFRSSFLLKGVSKLSTPTDDLTVRVWNVNSDSEKLTVEFRTRTTPISIATHPNHVEVVFSNHFIF